MALIKDTGFDAIDGGPLAESWRQQPITRAYCLELDAPSLRVALESADRKRAPRLREEMVEAFAAQGDKLQPRAHRACRSGADHVVVGFDVEAHPAIRTRNNDTYQLAIGRCTT